MERLTFGNPRAVEYVGRRHQTPALSLLYSPPHASCPQNDGKSQLMPIKKDRSLDEPVPEVNRVKCRGRQQFYTEGFSSV